MSFVSDRLPRTVPDGTLLPEPCAPKGMQPQTVHPGSLKRNCQEKDLRPAVPTGRFYYLYTSVIP
ncbi:MAG: hypothetical protein ACLR76_04770 [Alistipes sp.]